VTFVPAPIRVPKTANADTVGLVAREPCAAGMVERFAKPFPNLYIPRNDLVVSATDARRGQTPGIPTPTAQKNWGGVVLRPSNSTSAQSDGAALVRKVESKI